MRSQMEGRNQMKLDGLNHTANSLLKLHLCLMGRQSSCDPRCMASIWRTNHAVNSEAVPHEQAMASQNWLQTKALTSPQGCSFRVMCRGQAWPEGQPALC